MLKKFFISLSIVLSLSFTSCGGGSSKEARELLSKILQFVGIRHDIIVNVCQDSNRDGICGAKELFTKLTIKKGESLSDILRKISLTPDGRYFLETYDPDIPILVELHDPKNIKYDNGNFTLKFKGFKNHEQNEIKEISAIQSLEDAGYLTADETKALKALENREAVDRVIFESLENNYNRLRDEKLPNKIAVEKGLESVALGLQTLDIQKELPTKLDSCANDNSCIKEIVTTTSKELNITQEEAEVIADEVKKDKKPKSQKNIADGYIAHLSSPIEAKCSDDSHFTTTVGLKGAILFDTELDDSCEIIVPSSAIIDSNNNGMYDNNDKRVGFTMRGLADGTFITPLTTLLLIKESKGENVSTFKAMVKDFNPVSSASAVGFYRGEKKNRVQKLMLLMEVLKTAMRKGADVSSIDLAQIISNIPFKDMDLNKLLGGVSDIMKSKIMDSLKLSGVADLISQLDTFDKSKVDLNTLMVNVSDGGIGVDDALEVAKKVPVVTPTPMSTPTLSPIVLSTPTPTPTFSPIVTPISTPTPTATENYNRYYSFFRKDGIKVQFNFEFPTNSVLLDDDDLTFNPKDFKATRIEDETDVTTDIKVLIYHEGHNVAKYDKTRLGRYVFKYIYNGKDIAEYFFTIVKRDTTPRPTPILPPVVVTPTPPNQAPIANAGENKTVTVNTTITLTGSGTDSDGSIIRYEWRKGDIVLATTATFQYLPTVIGTDELTLVVTDDDGAVARDIMVVTVTKNSASTISKGLVAHYEFEGNANDSSGNGNDGVEHGGVSYADGVIGKSVKFSTYMDLLELPQKVLNTTISSSVSFWIKLDESKIFAIISAYGTNTIYHNEYNIWIDNGSVKAIHDRILSNKKNLNDFKYHMLSIITTNVGIKYYLDGLLIEYIQNIVKPMNISSNIWLGNDQDCINGCWEKSQQFYGELDDLRIYNRALNESEIQELYNLKQN